jgi:hypothetical protein
MRASHFGLWVATIIFLHVSSFSQPAGKQWPFEFPCRLNDSHNRDLFVMTLGDVRTPLATALFDPAKDEVRLNNGHRISNYFHDTVGIEFFKPIDKEKFPLPPSGWCSWYYYYQHVNEDEVRRNAEWMAEHLKDYGAVYVQIDDGWQGVGHGSEDNRDWSTVDKYFPRGMDTLASYIKQLGLTPGIWLAPHGQSNPEVVKNNPGVFLLKKDGTSPSETWEGKFLVDPSSREGLSYLGDLFARLRKWGYEYFKIDGQPIVVNEYKKNQSMFKDSSANPIEAYRKTISTIRSAIGRDNYLLGCWGIPLEGVGIMNGSRTGDDVVLGWRGLMTAVDATMKFYCLHNVAWYCDPDVMLLRSPLTIEQARVWATLQGLTGQALMASDRMMDLSDERVELLKRVYPAADIRPLDLFPSQRNKRIWDLKVNHLGRQYDVVGMFNFNETKSERASISWSELGITDTGAVHVFDFWNKEYLGCWKGGMNIQLPSTSCRVLTLLSATGGVELVSTSRHITQGSIDLVTLNHNADGTVWQGKSKVIKNDPYELRFVFPRGMSMLVKNTTAGGLPPRINNHQGWATVEFTSPSTTEVEWHVEFVSTKTYYSYPTLKPDNLTFDPIGLDGAMLRWSSQYYLNEGYQVYWDGKLLGYTPDNAFALRDLEPHRTYSVQVSSVWQDGTESKDRAEIKFTLADQLPKEFYLSDLEPVRGTIGWGTIEVDRAVTAKLLTVGGREYHKGIGTHANSDIEFRLYGMFDTFSTQVGVDEGNNSEKGSVEFVVIADGKEMWRSGVMMKKDGAKALDLNISGVRSLLLRVTDAGDGIDYDHADWIEARIK